METFVKQTLLYDFYGDLLTDHQRRIYEEVVFDDFSVSEVARDEGISRQGIHDLIKRCNKILNEYEDRLHLVEKFLAIREYVQEIDTITKNTQGSVDGRMKQISDIASKILEEL